MSEEIKEVKESKDMKVESSGVIKMDKMKILTILVSVTLILSLINTFGIFFSGSSNSVTGDVVKEENVPAPSVPSEPSNVKVNIEGAPVKGDKNAPVTIVEYTDYECPFCGRAYQQTYPLIKSEYIERGKVKYVVKDFPLSFHPNAQKAAEAAHCVREQKGDEGYFSMHDKIFENQQSLSVDNYKNWARELGVNGAQFDSCLDSGKMAGTVRKGFSEGQSDGVQGTPAFFINGKLISGAQPYPAFQQAIDAELS